MIEPEQNRRHPSQTPLILLTTCLSHIQNYTNRTLIAAANLLVRAARGVVAINEYAPIRI